MVARLVVVVVPLVFALVGCCPAPWSLADAPTVPPDEQYREPSQTHGNDVYLWTCYQGHHVVVSQFSAEMSCQPPKMELFDCGTVSPLEQATPADQRTPVPVTRRWPK